MRGGTGSSIWHLASFRSYLGASSATMLAFSMQQLLISWLLIGVLHTDPEHVGIAQAMIGVPGLFLMLWGGASADRVDPRGLLVRVYLASLGLPLLLLVVDRLDLLGYWSVTAWGLLMSVAMSFQTPAQAAILNRSAGRRIQEAVTAATGAGFIMQVIGLALAGQMETVGLDTVLICQSLAIGAGAFLIARLPAADPVTTSPSAGSGAARVAATPVAPAIPVAPATAVAPATSAAPPTPGAGKVPPATAAPSALRSIIDGLVVIRHHPVLLHVLIANFVSMLFNAGSFFLIFPFLMTKVYGGDAAFLSIMLVVFYAGAVLVNFILLRFMPLQRPGRLFLGMQLTRAVIFAALLFQPPLPLLVVVIFLWGMNMGITTTTSRAIIQESAAEAYRGRILSVYNVGALGAQPLGALVLGFIVAQVGIVNGLAPGLIVSVGLFVYGMALTPIWGYESMQAEA